MATSPPLSIIIPTLNEAKVIMPLLISLQAFRARGCEVVVADGGSADDTAKIAAPWVDAVVRTRRGRAIQMNAGAAGANSALLWFVHADSQLPDAADNAIINANNNLHAWGFFHIKLSGHQQLLRLIETAMNWRVRITHVVTGDHGLFMSRSLFDAVGGFEPIELMEDIATSKKLRSHCKPHYLPLVLTTSSRRWESHGIVRTVWLMWCLRWRYFFGASPSVLATHYRQF